MEPEKTKSINAPQIGDEAANDTRVVSAAPHSSSTQLAELESQLEFYREKAVMLDNQVFQMRTLLQSGKGFSELMNISTLLEAFMQVCRERYNFTTSSVMLLDDLDPYNVFYRVRAYHGLPANYVDRPSGLEEETLLFRIPQNQGLLWQVIQQGEVFSVRDMVGEPRFRTAFDRWQLEVLKSDVWVPLIRGGQALGILTLGVPADGWQMEEDYTFLEEIAAVAATNIDSTLKYEKNARILKNLQTLYDVNQQLADVNDFKQLTIETLSTAVEALRAQKANLMLYDPETNRLEIKVVWGNIPKHTRDAINDGRMETKSFAMGEGVAGECLQRGKPVRLNDRTKIPQVGRNMVYCILAAPLMHGRDPVGVITLTNKVKEENGERVLDNLGRFGEDDEQLLLALADQASVNLHKARLYSASITDRLTGLYNARHFEATLDAAIETARVASTPVSLAVTDIDHFKRFNDTYGHKAGDFVLAQTAELLRAMAREEGIDGTFRYGGEEFCLVMTGYDSKRAADVVERYRRRIEETEFDYEGQSLRVSVSVGVAGYPHEAPTRSSLFQTADKALYRSKSDGRNRVTVMVGEQTLPYAELGREAAE